jgi:hypothetical protein
MSDTPRDSTPTRMPIAILVGIFAVIILGVGAFYLWKRGQPAPDAETTGGDSQTVAEAFQKVEYKLPIARVVDGTAEEMTEETLAFPTFTGEIVLWIDVTWPHVEDKNYNMIINDSEGEGLYKVWIPPQYLEEGKIPLRLNGSMFGVGGYAIEVLEEGADSVSTLVAESQFRINE